MTTNASRAEETPAPGRRDRKRQETRRALIRSAIELFSERGFDAVTVTDISQHADVDPSTFFRHFGTKEAVLFTDMDDYIVHSRRLLAQRADGESVIEMLKGVIDDLAETTPFDPSLELLRARLTEASPEMQAQTLVHREELTQALASELGARLGINAGRDPRPYLAANVWVAALQWYRHLAVNSSRRKRIPPRKIVEEVVRMVEEVGPFLTSRGKGRRSSSSKAL
jgi:AcrR family transcriptional regulator